MKIEILGTGCAKCRLLFESAQKAVQESGLTADVAKVDCIRDIIDYGVMVTPALVIDGEVKTSGRIPSVDEIKNWIKK
ncbi:MAG: thioredoxin family protein [Elusimicrobia bacterium HGW-Elusimicrobia-1]|jgi:small redox-active disulfide protein 2|nr:MAG: thioredoxin family protein [Elusimicrobia bacterium HGW-Elusimicrobia-1]